MQNAPRERPTFAGLDIEPHPIEVKSSKFDIAVFASEKDSTIALHWVFSTELFDRSTIERFTRSFETLLRSAIANPDVRLSGLDHESDFDREKVTSERVERKQALSGKLANIKPQPVTIAHKIGN